MAEGTVAEKCIKLKGICRHFNFVEELNAATECMRTGLSTLTTTKSRESAEEFIKSLDHLAEELQKLCVVNYFQW